MSANNGLSDAEEERLTLLIEECAEIIQAASKIKRFGKYSNFNGGPSNIQQLQHEIGDLNLIQDVMCEKGDISGYDVNQRTIDKRTKINQYLRHNVF